MVLGAKRCFNVGIVFLSLFCSTLIFLNGSEIPRMCLGGKSTIIAPPLAINCTFDFARIIILSIVDILLGTDKFELASFFFFFFH